MELRKLNLILKFNKIFKKGYVPARGAKDYFALHNGTCIAEYFNCFGHACFNPLDEQIEEEDFSYAETRPLFNVLGNETFPSARAISEKVFDFVRATGLSVEECGLYDKMKSNQWKVAFYIDKGDNEGEFKLKNGDTHFMLQEKNGKWSSKMGDCKTLQYFQELPTVFDCDYALYGIYKITNPYAESKSEEQILLQA